MGQLENIQSKENMYLPIQHCILHSDAVGFSIMESDLVPCPFYLDLIFKQWINWTHQIRTNIKTFYALDQPIRMQYSVVRVIR